MNHRGRSCVRSSRDARSGARSGGSGTSLAVVGSGLLLGGLTLGVAVIPATNRVYVNISGSDVVRVVDGGVLTAIGADVPTVNAPHGIIANPVTGRAYTVGSLDNALASVGAPRA